MYTEKSGTMAMTPIQVHGAALSQTGITGEEGDNGDDQIETMINLN
jgi:hypothetical protein